MGLANSLIKVLRVIDQQGLNLFRVFRKGYSISSHDILEGIGSHCKTVGTVIDVGANQGQFALASHLKFPKARIISFEPLPEVYEIFRQNLKGISNITIHNMALGNENGTIDFYKNEHSHASSALVISEKQKAEIPITANTQKTQVSVKRLDEVIDTNTLQRPILLKLDVQGYEKNVLAGSTKALPNIDYIVFEASFVAMYEGEPLFDEMHSFMKDHGFELVAPVGHLSGKNQHVILQMDFLYKNVKS